MYGPDRLFVRLRAHDAPGEDQRDAAIGALTSMPAPVVEIDLPEPLALGAEFMRWEIATAIAGAILAIDPFDQPNVQQAKDATSVLLDRVQGERTPADSRHPTPRSTA